MCRYIYEWLCSLLTSNKNDLAVACISIDSAKIRVIKSDSLWDISKATVHSNQLARLRTCRVRLQAGMWLWRRRSDRIGIVRLISMTRRKLGKLAYCKVWTLTFTVTSYCVYQLNKDIKESNEWLYTGRKTRKQYYTTAEKQQSKKYITF